MVSVEYYSQAFPCNEGQTVLEVLLENGQDIQYSCKMGVCVTCVMQLVEGDVPSRAQDGLRESLAEKGHFLPCVCHPTADMRVANIDQQDLFSPAVVDDIQDLSRNIRRIFLEPTTPLYYHAGQFMNLRREDGMARPYSLASVPSLDDRLEFHVKRLPGGQISNWILDDLQPGDHLGIQGPAGNCFYRPGHEDQNMLLIGNGTGLAPLIGIARDALNSAHTGPIELFHGSRTLAGLYLGDELRTLAATHENFHYMPCISGDGDPETEGYRQGRADDVAFSDHADLKDWRVFLCGYPPMVNSAKDRALAAGVETRDVYADPFELKELRKRPRS
jgi:NAD(P)H-flavin reductase